MINMGMVVVVTIMSVVGMTGYLMMVVMMFTMLMAVSTMV